MGYPMARHLVKSGTRSLWSNTTKKVDELAKTAALPARVLDAPRADYFLLFGDSDMARTITLGPGG
jgi:3-hydroxyisobutyrate dehydrogenase-like beta-hydroxyacid dehydrogenase